LIFVGKGQMLAGTREKVTVVNFRVSTGFEKGMLKGAF
jgi:hypothetical protein